MVILKIKPKNSKELQAGLDQVGTGEAYTELRVSGLTTIDNQLFMNSGTRLTCNKGTVWKLMNNAPTSIFGEQDPILTQHGKTINGLYLDGVTFDGNFPNQGKTPDDHGLGYGNFIGLTKVTNSIFQNISVLRNEGDGFRITRGSGLRFLKNYGADGGHDFIHLNECANVDIGGNTVSMRSNNVVRVRGSHGVDIHGNTCLGTPKAYAPVYQLELHGNGSLYDILIRENLIKDSYGPGVWAISTGAVGAAKRITIRNNVIKNCGLMPKANRLPGVGGIIFDGVDLTIQNNTIDGCYGRAIGYDKYVSESGRSGFTATITGNIITNTKASLYPGTASGTGIYAKDSHYTFKCSGNCLYGNKRDYYNVTGKGDVLTDPQYVSPATDDYHLKKTSPCPGMGRYAL